MPSVDNDAWDRAIQLLKAYSRVSQSAQRYIAALEMLLTKVQSTSLKTSSEGANREGLVPEEPHNLQAHKATQLGG